MRLTSILLCLSLLVMASCAGYDPSCPPAAYPADDAPLDTSSFESAVDELDLAIAATPEWDKRTRSRDWVRGLADLAIERADALDPWRATSDISCGAIELCKLHVRRRAQIPGDWRPGAATTARLDIDPQAQIERVRDERAWWRNYEALPWLERYVAAGIRSEWLHRRALPAMRADLERVIAVPPPSMGTWEFQDIPAGIHAEYRIRAAAVLEGLDAIASGDTTATIAP